MTSTTALRPAAQAAPVPPPRRVPLWRSGVAAALRALMGHSEAFQPGARRPTVWACVLGGAGIGLCWGIVARLWMRLMSTHPEFTVAGTAFILGAAAQFGAVAGLAYAARRRGWQRWRLYAPRALAVVSAFALGAGPGATMVAPALLAALAISRRGWWRPVRVLLALLALAGLAALSFLVVSEKPGPIAAVNVALCLALMYPLALGLRMGLEPYTRSGEPVAGRAGR